MTKVTYYMYYCDTCCKIREKMEMDGLCSAKCQKSRRGDISGIFDMLMIIRQNWNSDLLQIKGVSSLLVCLNLFSSVGITVVQHCSTVGIHRSFP